MVLAQSRVAEAASRMDERDADSGIAGTCALWLIVLGLGLVGVVLIVS